MRPLQLSEVKSILCIGAHPDDIEIGCGGTLAKLIDRSPASEIFWSVFSGNDPRRAEAQASADDWLSQCHAKVVEHYSFADGFFPGQWSDIKRQFQELATRVSPDLIFVHRLEDRHQDHRLLAELTWQTFRNHLILEYEIPKYEGDLAQPNLFVELDSEQVTQKIDRLLKHFGSQVTKPWFDRELFEGHLRLRGVECHQKYAEAFYARKTCLQI